MFSSISGFRLCFTSYTRTIMDNSTPSGSSKKIKSVCQFDWILSFVFQGLLKRVRDKILQEVSVDTKTVVF